ncbi:Uncharacterized protein BM_BM17257 [Brugia malayi]|uniref:SURF1-like protein n=1 Tax=Brugia malayi TaxID=6279 RepID=A0A4E9FX41_BRUMA|nr:Uncharacterized protein BM_BM17257 [Brugia malayi]VIP00438.1 Uncharacterized protein BM_BM17257 [Brugia malayi]
MKQEAVPFPDDNLSSLDDLEYAKVKVTGEFLHDHEFYVQPRQRFDKEEKKSKIRPAVNNFGSPGAQVITPFKLHPSGSFWLIADGFLRKKSFLQVELKDKCKDKLPLMQYSRHTEKRPSFIRRNDPDNDLWFYTDVEQMAEKHGTLPVLVDACYESSIRGGPIGGQTRVSHRNDHMMYACFWFSIGAATLFGWFL